MAQSEIQVTTTPPLPGTQLVQEINDALETIATDFSGAIDPAANAFAYSLWADTGTGDLKRRNAANSAWTTIGRIYPVIVENSSGELVNPAYTGTLTGGTGVVNIGSGQVYKDASGNVGIGTASPSNKLHVYGASGAAHIKVEDSSGLTGKIQARASSGLFEIGTTSNNGLGFFTNNTERAILNSSGSFSVPQVNNDTTAAAANVNMQGDGYFRRSTSALKYKQDIRDLENIDINLFRPVRYKSKCEADDQTKDHIGIIADEVANAGIEELVNRNESGEVEGFQYERLTVVLLKAIQELKAEFDAYKAAHP